MTLRFQPVLSEEELQQLAEMASFIWHEYWPPRIGEAQTDYMVDMFHSVDAMKHDMAEHGYRYWFLIDDQGKYVGYTAGATQHLTGDDEADAWMKHGTVLDEGWPDRWFISKIYLYAEERGKHFTVNRDNELGIRAYEGNGFVSVEDVDAEIGKGFVMQDHIMVKTLN